jgi:hypothetical protein
MPAITELNSSPYWDDYSPEERDFLRILFRPGYAVQARELNQLQSILQEQVSRFGSHIFSEGSIVVGGQTTINTAAKYLKLEEEFNSSTVTISGFIDSTTGIGYVIEGAVSHAKGIVTVAIEKTSTDPKTLIYTPTNGLSFIAGENVIVDGVEVATLMSTSFNGDSSTVSISPGIFFTKGIFVINERQTTYLEKYSNTPNKVAGLLSEPAIINEDDDESLTDNAIGSYNYAAPGAHRLKINLTLTSKDPDDAEKQDIFINILEVKNGKLFKQVDRPTYSEIMKTLARRTHDESGNYTVTPFILNLETYGGATGAFKAKISPGKAYVKGFEIEKIATEVIDIPTAKDISSTTTVGAVPVSYGNIVSINFENETSALPDFNSFEKMHLYDSGATGPIGTARLRDIQYNGATGPTYNVSLFDINIAASSKSFSDVIRMSNSNASYSSSNTRMRFWNDVGATGVGVLQEPSNASMVYDLGFNAAAALTNVSVIGKRVFNTKTVSSNTTTIETNNSESGPVSIERFVGTAGATGMYNTGSSTVYQNYVAFNSATGAQISNFQVSLDNPADTTKQIATLTFPSLSSGTVNVLATVVTTKAQANIKDEITVPHLIGNLAAATTSSTFITLPPGASSVNSYYVGCKIKFTSGTGSSSTLYDISGYTGSTRVAVINAAVTVDSTTIFEICPSFTSGASNVTNGNLYSATSSGTIYLQKPDAIKIIKIISNVTAPEQADWFNPTKDVTNRFVFDNGQRDTYYDTASIKLKPGYSVPGPIHVFFEYFDHDLTHDGFFSVDSYSNKEVPRFYKDSTGKSINLLNCIDIRPTRAWASGNTGGFESSYLPSFDTQISYSVSYYLDRIDKIVLAADGSFKHIKGKSALIPKEPPDLADGMTLYKLYLPAFTYTIDSIMKTYVENKRYTMRDIGKLESRIENLEYYTALNALEKNTAAFNVKDTDGNDRFKNGILVDPFNGHNIGDISNPDYRCSIDIVNRDLFPPFIQKAYNLELIDGATGFYKRGDLITAPIEEETFISQMLASRAVNVNPYSVFDWIGHVTLTPDNDFWKDTAAIPTCVNNANGLLDNVVAGNDPAGSIFNQWNNNQYGVPQTKFTPGSDEKMTFPLSGTTVNVSGHRR